jgi:putative GTP pyrophosphokinase
MKDDEFINIPLPDDLVATTNDDVSKESALNQAKSIMWSIVRYKELRLSYSCALKSIQTNFEGLNSEFELKYKRNPIKSISTRLKKTESIVAKLIKYKVPLTLESLEKNINDVAGIRVVCPYIDDIYKIADALLSQDDVTLITKKDYIEKPKPNGYRSLHLIISIPVFFESGKKDVRVEVQIRTIAMDFWASLEHQIKYKRNIPEQESVSAELKQCADLIAETDVKMLNLRNKIDIAEDVQSDNDLLKEKLRKFDI